MQFVRLAGVTHHYQTIGSPREKPALVLVNSLGTDFRIWRDVIVRLAGEFAILAYDMRGHGLSDIGPTPYAIDDLGDDLAALMAHAGFAPAVVCGISVGGLVAQALCARRPELVRALVLADTLDRIGSPAGWTARLDTVGAGGIEAIADAVLAGWFTPAFHAAMPADVAGYRAMLARQPAAGYLATCAALRDADLTAATPHIAVPALCVVGEADATTTPALVADFARRIPGARFELIRGAGHIPCVEQPVVFAGIVRAFAALLETEMTSNVGH